MILPYNKHNYNFIAPDCKLLTEFYVKYKYGFLKRLMCCNNTTNDEVTNLWIACYTENKKNHLENFGDMGK